MDEGEPAAEASSSSISTSLQQRPAESHELDPVMKELLADYNIVDEGVLSKFKDLGELDCGLERQTKLLPLGCETMESILVIQVDLSTLHPENKIEHIIFNSRAEAKPGL